MAEAGVGSKRNWSSHNYDRIDQIDVVRKKCKMYVKLFKHVAGCFKTKPWFQMGCRVRSKENQNPPAIPQSAHVVTGCVHVCMHSNMVLRCMKEK